MSCASKTISAAKGPPTHPVVERARGAAVYSRGPEITLPDDTMAAQLNEVPEKLFYKIGEVCQYTDTQPYVLRFWESEFPQLAPEKNRSGQRVFRREDIELIFRIKQLLYEEEYTIAGARRRLEQEIAGQPPVDQPGDRTPSGPQDLAPLPPPVPLPSSRTREARRLPLDELLPDDPAAPAAGSLSTTAESSRRHPAAGAEEVETLRREAHELRAALARAERNLQEAQDARGAAEAGRIAADEGRRAAEDQRNALRAKLHRAAARIEEALERLGPGDSPG